jgi:heme A synthase
MTDTVDRGYAFPRWLHVSAVLLLASTFLLLILGQLVTSFRAGMADPVWPTEPWYLFSNYKLDLGYLIEHTHRIAGFAIGALVTLLAAGFWITETCAAARWIALFGMFVLLGGYGQLHGGLIAQRNVSASEVRLPLTAVYVIVAGLAILFGVALVRLAAGVRGSSMRLLASTALVAIMIQGLLGGFRVKLNELVGTDLAAVHGVFAQIVLGLVVSLSVLTERPGIQGRFEYGLGSLRWWSIGLVAVVFIQIVWGALVRHNPTPLSQRLHFLTAFVAVTIAVLLLRAVFGAPAARSRAGFASWGLAILLALQLYLGVEAWMVKFGNYVLPELVLPTPENAAIRTLHALIGTGILATTLALAIRLNRTSTVQGIDPAAIENKRWTENQDREVQEIEVAVGLRGEMA